MIDGYKIVVNTAAGRRRYMQYLIPQIVQSDVVDRYDIWVNTTDRQDIAFFERCAEHFPKINLVWQPEGVVNGVKSINAFYLDCLDEDTIYIKMDDDIVWLEPDFFDKMVRFRIDNPEYFVVSPLVINNALSTYILQLEGKIKFREYLYASSSHETSWKSGAFAAELHNWFMPKLREGSYKDLYCGAKPVAMNRFSINSILWFGKDFATWKGIVPGDDEEFLSCIKPTMEGKACCFNGDCIISHFAFFPQREMLDKETVLERYGLMLREMWGGDVKMSRIDAQVREAMDYVEACKAEIMQRPAIYKSVPKAPKSALSKLGDRMPALKRMYKAAREGKEKGNYIVE